MEGKKDTISLIINNDIIYTKVISDEIPRQIGECVASENWLKMVHQT